MENTPRLHDTLVQVLSQHDEWLDVRHVKTLAWMLVGLIQSGLIGLNAWAPYVLSRATMAQSTVRRFARWLDNERIVVHQLYGPLIQQALAEWGQHMLYLALDTSLLWDRYCLVRISLIYRGRAVPLVWCVLEHASSSVAYEVYKTLLDQAAALLPLGCRVVFLADRGFVDTALMAHLRLLHLGAFASRTASGFTVASAAASSVSYTCAPDALISGTTSTSRLSASARCIWPWRTYPATPTTGWWSAMSRRTCRPLMNMACASTSKRISWTINRTASSWRPP